MFSMLLNEVAPPPPLLPLSTADASPTMIAPAPRFPTYLLPSFSRPFRPYHRRQSSSLPSSGNTVPAGDDVPSLSNSPTNSDTSSVPESPPTSPSSSPPSPSRSTQVKEGRRRPSTEWSDGPRLAQVQPDTIRCSACSTDIAFTSQIVSKGFTGRYGRAYLVSAPEESRRKLGAGATLINIKIGKAESRNLVTGLHIVSDIQCATCRARIGWKYVDAKEESQKYKIGKFILETQRTVTCKNWDDATANEILELEFEPPKVTAAAASDGDDVMFDSDDSDECEDLFAGVWDARNAAKRRKLKLSQRRK